MDVKWNIISLVVLPIVSGVIGLVAGSIGSYILFLLGYINLTQAKYAISIFAVVFLLMGVYYGAKEVFNSSH